MATKIQIRGGLAATWTTVNPILAEREMGIETDTLKFKFGNDVDAWDDLDYAGGGAAAWGGITGLLADQTDLVAALAAKQNSLGFTPENVANKAVDFSTLNDTLYPSVKAVNDKINAALEGTKPKADARIATTANITLLGLQTIDGVLTVALDRILVKDQAIQSENGIYIAAVGAWARSTDADTGAEIQGALISVDEGTTNHDTTWRQSSDNVTLGSTAIVWVQFGASTPDASSTTKGKAKLFITEGSGTDGAMDQASTTAALALKEALANKNASGGYPGLSLFKIMMRNDANTFTSLLHNTNAAARTYLLQDRDGTLADDTDLAAKENTGVALVLDNLLPWKSVRVRTIAALPANTINGGYTVITLSAVGVLTVDGVATLLGDKILVADENSDDKKNGIYEVTTEGTASVAAVLTRSGDANSGAKINGAMVSVRQGSQIGTLWFQSTPTPTFGTSSIIFKPVPPEPLEVTGVVVQFDGPRHYGMGANPAETGNITLNSVNLRKGVTQFMRHNSGSTPSFGSEFEVIQGTYTVSVNNLITFYCSSASKIFVTILPIA